MRRVLLGVAAMTAVAGCAPVQPPGGAMSAEAAPARARQCFSSENVNGFRVVDGQTVDLTIGANRVFRAQLLGTCPELRDVFSLGVRTRGGATFVCDDNDVDLVVPGRALGPRICPVTSLRERTRAELDAERAAPRR
jgi:hypothetical protein